MGKAGVPNQSESAIRLRVDAVEGAGEGDGFAYVVEAADPGDGAFDSHAEAGVGDASIAAQVKIPLEGFFGQVVLFDAGVEQLKTGNSL